MKTTKLIPGVLLPFLALMTVAACGGGGGGGGGGVSGPSNLDYGTTSVALTRGIAATTLTPTYTGTADAFAVTAGSLPLGLSIDGVTGVISGLPTGVQAATAATVTASLTGGGSDAVALTFTVDTGATRALYAASETSGVISVLNVDAATGLPTVRGDVSGLDSPLGMALTPDLGMLYAANSGTGLINGYSVAPGTGDLTELSGSPFAMTGGVALTPNDLVVSPDGSTLYSANRLANSISMFSIAANGALTELAGSPFGAYQTARNLATTHLMSGDYLYLIAPGEATNRLISFSIASDGTLTEIDADTTGVSPSAIAATVAGDFVYVANQTDFTVSSYAVASDGTLTELAGSPTALDGSSGFVTAVAIADDGTTRSLYVTSNNGVTSQLAVAGDGSLSLLTPGAVTAASAVMRDIVAAPDAGTVYAVNSNLFETTPYSVGAGGALTPLLDMPRLRMPAASQALLVLPSATVPAWSTDNLYAVTTGSNSLTAFDIDATGAMTGQVPLETAVSTSPEDIAISRDGGMLYITHPGSLTAPLMTVPILADGSLDGLNTTPVAGNNAQFLAIDNNSDFLYVVDGVGATIKPFPLDASGQIGAPGAAGSLGLVPFAVTLDPSGRFAYAINFGADTVSQFSVDIDTGALTPLTPATVNTGQNPIGITVHPSGRFVYVTARGASGAGGDAIGQYVVLPSSGNLVLLTPPQITADVDPGAISVTPNGRYVIVASTGTSSISTYLVNTLETNGIENGSLSGPISTISTATQPQKIAVSADGSTVYVGINVGTGIEAFSIDSAGMLSTLDSEATSNGVHAMVLLESRM